MLFKKLWTHLVEHLTTYIVLSECYCILTNIITIDHVLLYFNIT